MMNVKMTPAPAEWSPTRIAQYNLRTLDPFLTLSHFSVAAIGWFKATGKDPSELDAWLKENRCNTHVYAKRREDVEHFPAGTDVVSFHDPDIKMELVLIFACRPGEHAAAERAEYLAKVGITEEEHTEWLKRAGVMRATSEDNADEETKTNPALCKVADQAKDLFEDLQDNRGIVEIVKDEPHRVLEKAIEDAGGRDAVDMKCMGMSPAHDGAPMFVFVNKETSTRICKYGVIMDASGIIDYFTLA